MTQPEYELKKEDCWEELWDEISGNIDFAPGVDDRMKEHIYDTFDRAFALGKQEKDAEETVLSGWVARDDGERWHERELHLFTRNKPERRKLMGDWIGRPSMTLDSNLFPGLTWSDEPQEVEITIKRKKNG